MSNFEKYLNNNQERKVELSLPFLAKYLSKATGDQIRVLLAYDFLEKAGHKMNYDILADLLETTSQKVEKAIEYWIREGIIFPFGEKQTGDQEYTSEIEINEKEGDLLTEQMMIIMEIGMGRELSTYEISVLSDIIYEYHFDFPLMSFLFEYCIIRKKNSFSYMKKVAESWYRKDILTALDAEHYVEGYSSIVSKVSKSFGIHNRMLADVELRYVEKWIESKYSEEFITEACERTILHIGKSSFQYADCILKRWEKAGLKTLSDIKKYDKIHKNINSSAKGVTISAGKKSNFFHNFKEREYDYDALERTLMNKNKS